MNAPISIDTDYLLKTLQRLLSTPSPAGHTARGMEVCHRVFCEIENVRWQFETTPKGVLTATWDGRKDDAPRAVTAHVDTLGALVKNIKANGRLQLFQIGSFDWTAIENEAVTIERADGSTLRGTVLFRDEAYHTHGRNDRPEDTPRTARNMEVRLDAKTDSEKSTRELGVEVGDFIHFDTRTQVENGFVRSRFLDDKACLACVFAALKAVADVGSTPGHRTTIHISNYEEVCHGGANGLPRDLHELVAVDVAPVASSQNSDEFSCSLCVADDDGPYSYDLNRKLKNLAKENEIALRPDIYPQYASDVKAYWKAGGGARVACIGPGTDATHGYERTHIDALEATAKLLASYLLTE
jgi:putative aminopeptidase FrvX